MANVTTSTTVDSFMQAADASAARSAIGAASTLTSISAGTGLTGGGDLSADRTLAVSYGTTAGTAAEGNDTRLSNARTPLAHKSSHATGGSDALSPSDIGAAPTDSPALTGTPTSTTAAAGTNTTQIATTAFVQSNKGDRYKTTSTSSNSIGLGAKTFTVEAGLSYTATQDVTAVADDSNHMHGSVTSYSGTTLVLNVTDITGSGTYTNWAINVGGVIGGTALQRSNNLSDVANTATALTNIGGVPTSRSISAGTGLTGGGDLSANRTLDVKYGTTTGTAAEGNDSRLSDSRTPTAHKSTHATGGSDALSPSDIGAAPTSRSISTGNGLTGGGDLTADRTLSVSFGSTSTTACAGDDSRLSDSRTPTAHASSHAAGGSDQITITAAQISGSLTQNTSGNAAGLSATLAVTSGGTGQTSYTDGQLLIGNSATGGLSKATLQAGSNVTITNGNGTITIAASGGGGGGSTGVAGSQVSSFTGTGSQTDFAPIVGYSDTTVGSYLVSVGGIDQRPTTDYTILSTGSGTISFATAPPNGAPIVVRAFSGVAVTDVQRFTSSGTWTKPAGAKSVQIVCIGGGSGGGSGRKSNGLAGGGSGGGGGAHTIRTIEASLLGATETVTVGAGGTGGASISTDSTVGLAGTIGGNSTFGTTTTFAFSGFVAGGLAGLGGTAGSVSGGVGGSGQFNGGTGGTGGTTAGGDSATSNGASTGGAGGGGTPATPTVFLAGGNAGIAYSIYAAGGAKNNSDGGAGGNGTSAPTGVPLPGTGGAGGSSSIVTNGSGGAGGNGGLYGGGGGGGGGSGNDTGTSGKGGDGAPGIVVVTTYF